MWICIYINVKNLEIPRTVEKWTKTSWGRLKKGCQVNLLELDQVDWVKLDWARSTLWTQDAVQTSKRAQLRRQTRKWANAHDRVVGMPVAKKWQWQLAKGRLWSISIEGRMGIVFRVVTNTSPAGGWPEMAWKWEPCHWERWGHRPWSQPQQGSRLGSIGQPRQGKGMWMVDLARGDSSKPKMSSKGYCNGAGVKARPGLIVSREVVMVVLVRWPKSRW